MKNIQPLHFVLGGAGLLVVGAILPWVSASSGPFSVSISGFDTDGKFTLLLGIAAGVLVILKNQPHQKLLNLIALICAGLAGLLSLIFLFRAGFSASGIGVYVSIIGGAAAAWGAYNLWNTAPPPPQNPNPPAPPGPPPA